MIFFPFPAALLPIRNCATAQTNTAPRAGAQAGSWLAYPLSLAIAMLFWVGSAMAQWTQMGSTINGTVNSQQLGSSHALSSDGSIWAIGASAGNLARVYTWNGSTWTQRGADLTGETGGDGFGFSVALSSDGLTLAVTAPSNDGAASNAGHVRVFTWNGAAWVQKGADIDGPAQANAGLGESIAISADGTTFIVGAPFYDGGASDNGLARAYSWDGSVWAQKGADIVGTIEGNAQAGRTVSMSSDGNTMAVGSTGENGFGGVTRVYTWNGSAWGIKGAAFTGSGGDNSAWAVRLTPDGNTLAIGTPYNGSTDIGFVSVYTWNGSTWPKKGANITGTANSDNEGRGLAISSDGNTIATGATLSSTVGRLRVFEYSGGAWVQKGSTISAAAGDGFFATFTNAVALSADGGRVASGSGAAAGGGTNRGTARAFSFITPQEINVKGNSTNIVSGDVTPATADHTSFGSVNAGSFLDRTFTIQNTGSLTLNITGLGITSDNGKFVVSGAPTTVAGGASATFTVRYTPTGAGTDNATITINNDDSDEGTYTFAVQGNLNNALNFDGSNDEVTGTVNVVGSSFTIETWFNNTNNSGNQTILGIGTVGAGNKAIHLYLNDAYLLVGFYGDDVSIPWTRPLAAWHHLAVTHDYASKVSTAYLDGVQIGSGTHGGNYSGNTSLVIGRSGFAGDYFVGSIDEVRIWNVVRTCGDINAVKDRELIGTETGLLAYYNFNKGVAGADNTGLTLTLDDIAGGDNNGTLVNFARTGATSNWVDASGNNVFGTTPALQPNLNVSVGVSGSTKDVGGYATGSTNDFTYTIHNTGGVDLSLTGTPIVNLTGGSDFAVLTQPAATTIAAGGSLTFVVRFTPVAGTNSATFSIASTDCEGTYTFTLTGKGITATPSPVRGNMMTFDGADDEVKCGTGINLANASFSVECWAKASVLGGETHLFSLGTGANNQGLHCRQVNNSSILFGFWNDDYSVGYAWDLLWHHFSFTYDAGTNLRSIYVDGNLLGTNTASGDFVGTGEFNIGAIVTGSVNRASWNGAIDEVRVWNTVRSRDQIRENMHSTLSGSESGLLAYYQFNEASGAATDAISGNNGTLVNAVRAASTVSVSKGAAAATRLTIPAGPSTQTFGNMQIRFTAMSAPAAGDEFVISQLEETPYNNVEKSVSNYWTVRQFGTQTFSYDQISFTVPSENTISATDLATPANLVLYKRSTNSGASNWGSAIGTGSSANNTTKSIVYSISPEQTSFSEFMPASTTSILFPVEWLAFEATPAGETVMLDWTTGSEQNNASFTAERSLNGVEFEAIGTVAAAGNSSSATRYTYTDAALPAARILHYRIRQTDMDGSTSHSEIRTVALDRASGLSVYPNPATNQLTVRVPAGIYTVSLADAAGRMMRSATTDGQGTILSFDLSNLAAGVYLLRAGTATVRVVKE